MPVSDHFRVLDSLSPLGIEKALEDRPIPAAVVQLQRCIPFRYSPLAQSNAHRIMMLPSWVWAKMAGICKRPWAACRPREPQCPVAAISSRAYTRCHALPCDAMPCDVLCYPALPTTAEPSQTKETVRLGDNCGVHLRYGPVYTQSHPSS